MKYEIEHKIELTISEKGNSVIRLTLKSNNGSLTLYGEKAVGYMKYNQYIFGEEELIYIKGLKETTDRCYNLRILEGN